MNRDQLAERHSAAIRRHYPTMHDAQGRPPRALLDDLSAIAEDYAVEHARNVIARQELRTEAAAVTAGDPPGTVPQEGGGGEFGPEPSPAVTPLNVPAKPAPRRTTARRTAKGTP